MKTILTAALLCTAISVNAGDFYISPNKATIQVDSPELGKLEGSANKVSLGYQLNDTWGIEASYVKADFDSVMKGPVLNKPEADISILGITYSYKYMYAKAGYFQSKGEVESSVGPMTRVTRKTGSGGHVAIGAHIPTFKSLKLKVEVSTATKGGYIISVGPVITFF